MNSHCASDGVPVSGKWSRLQRSDEIGLLKVAIWFIETKNQIRPETINLLTFMKINLS